MENLTWFLVAAAATYYLWTRREAKPTIGAPTAQREPDPTRWRHDGSQPIDKTWWEGTSMSFKSSYSEQINDLKDSL